MDIYVYSDESGVLDKVHNEKYVFGGIVFLDKESKDVWNRKYIKAERDVRRSGEYSQNCEIKACIISNKHKSKLYRSLNKCYKFGVVIEQKDVLSRIFENKKSKQRFLDYAYKRGLKNLFISLINKNIIDQTKVNNIFVFADEHTTATNGRYELRETLESEFKTGTYNYDYSKFFPPIFSGLNSVLVSYCNSNSTVLVRAADIVANNIYHKAVSGKIETDFSRNLYITKLP